MGLRPIPEVRGSDLWPCSVHINPPHHAISFKEEKRNLSKSLIDHQVQIFGEGGKTINSINQQIFLKRG